MAAAGEGAEGGAGAGASASASRVSPLRLCQFNVLAPSARICEPLDRVPWRERHEAICDFLLAERPDIVCLQEFDFEDGTPGFRELYTKRLGADFEIHCKQRTRGKLEGLALLVRRAAFMRPAEVFDLELEPGFCDRVAQVAVLEHRASGRRVVIANTHLTVAHAYNNHDIPMCRPLQIGQVLEALRSVAHPDSAVFLCADMNCDHLETEPPKGPYTAADVSRPVHMVFDNGYSSALHEIFPSIRPISHTCHYAQDGCTDYIFFRPDAHTMLSSALLWPSALPVDAAWSGSSGWSTDDPSATLSDHRPVLAEFHLVDAAVGAASEVSAL